tara:strand:+ start:1059 stop:1220 length:162 start_codon:yes stop_codon:yes gene_type:complete
LLCVDLEVCRYLQKHFKIVYASDQFQILALLISFLKFNYKKYPIFTRWNDVAL